MTTFLLGVVDVHGTAALCDYLGDHVDADDAVHVINSLVGGDATSAEDVRDGEDALNAARTRLAGTGADVETHQFVRGNEPHEDLLRYADELDADELVIGVRKRNPTAKVVFGSTAQRVLLNARVPVRVVPLVDLE
jgi:nucleotide-binding universal stress UspA family protein